MRKIISLSTTFYRLVFLSGLLLTLTLLASAGDNSPKNGDYGDERPNNYFETNPVTIPEGSGRNHNNNNIASTISNANGQLQTYKASILLLPIGIVVGIIALLGFSGSILACFFLIKSYLKQRTLSRVSSQILLKDSGLPSYSKANLSSDVVLPPQYSTILVPATTKTTTES